MSFPSLSSQLPAARGKIIENAPLAPYTWLRVGGPAQVLFLPADEADLALFLAQLPGDIRVTVLGAASNMIVRDGGVAGVVIKLPPSFGQITADPDTGIVVAGASALDKRVAQTAGGAGLSGLEFFVGVPGSIGGALRMNAGCYGAETRDRLTQVIALDRMGRRIIASPEEMGYAYRHSQAPDDWIFTAAQFQCDQDDPAVIEERMRAITAKREQSQPIREKTGGSTFKNPDPPGTANQRRSWVLIDQAGGRGLRVGGAQMSEQHCNFLINTGGATAADLEGLGEEIRARVKRHSGVDLVWEVKRIGIAAGG